MSQEDLKQRENDNKQLFEEYAVQVLKEEDRFTLQDLNYDILDLFKEDPDFQKSLENSLYKNEQKLTSKVFKLEEKEANPTVANWLRHFIKSEGTEMFDNVKLSQFLAQSENVKRLDEEEVELVKRLLLLYRNLKFFPESLKDLPAEQWEIVPIRTEENYEKKIEKSDKTDRYSSDEGSLPEEEKEIKQEKQEKEISSAGIDKEGSSRLEELKKYREQYPEGSLERKAIEGEMEELEK